MDEDIRIEMRGGGDIAFFSFYIIFFFARKRILQHFIGRNLARLCGFGEGWIIHAGLDVGGLRVEWGVGPYSPSLVYPDYSARVILAKIIVKKKNPYFNDLLRGFSIPSRPWSSGAVVSENSFFYILGHANQTSLTTTYNRSKVWGPVGCNCQKFVLEVLGLLNLRFSPETTIWQLLIPKVCKPSSTAPLNSMDSLRIIGTTCLHCQSTFYSLTTAYALNELKITQEVMPVMQLPLRVLRYVPLTTGMRLIRSGGTAYKKFFALLRSESS